MQMNVASSTEVLLILLVTNSLRIQSISPAASSRKRTSQSGEGGGDGCEPELKRRAVTGSDKFFAVLPDGHFDCEHKLLQFSANMADGQTVCIFQRECF
jgi:hypothetical protein